MIYDDENVMLADYQNGFPKDFKDYEELLRYQTFDNLCKHASLSEAEKSECTSISNGIFEKGIRSALLYLAENVRRVIMQYRSSPVKSAQV